MVVLRATARHVLRGLDIIGPQCVHARNTRRDRSNAEQADYDEFRYNRLDGALHETSPRRAANRQRAAAVPAGGVSLWGGLGRGYGVRDRASVAVT